MEPQVSVVVERKRVMSTQQEAEAVKAWMKSQGYKPERQNFGHWKGYVIFNEDQPEFISDWQAARLYKASKQVELSAKLIELEWVRDVQPHPEMLKKRIATVRAELHRLQKGDV